MLMSKVEKIAYLKALVAVARSDDDLAESELTVIREASEALDIEFKESYLEDYDLEKIAGRIQTARVRRMLINDIQRLIDADDKREPGELQVLKYFCETWGQTPPDLEGVNWSTIVLPKDMREISRKVQARALKIKQRLIGATKGRGIQWISVFAGTGIIMTILLSLLLVFAIAGVELLSRGEDLRSNQPPFVNWLGAGLAVLVFFLAGLVTARISPGRTIKEPAIGAVVPIVFVVLFASYVIFQQERAMLLLDQDIDRLQFSKVVTPMIGVGGVAYVVTIIGAFFGEAFQLKRLGK